ncbi:MAG: hypothetical protein HZC25_06200 [Rhodospirillales bacterium]|nr:hypothetical protein [Rhodospirillales bacterium]
MLQRVLDSLREHSAEFREIKSRLSQIEHAIGGLHRDNAVHSENAALLNARMDRLSDRLARVERRLEIGEA